jgi:hypothetical protein
MALLSPTSLSSSSKPVLPHLDLSLPLTRRDPELWKRLFFIRVEKESNYWADSVQPLLKIGDWVELLADPNPQQGFLAVRQTLPHGTHLVKHVPVAIFNIHTYWPNHYFRLLEFIVDHPPVLNAMLAGIPSFKIGEILLARQLLDRALDTMFELEINSKMAEPNTLFRSLTPALVLASTVSSLPTVISYKRFLVMHLAEVSLTRAKSKDNQGLVADLDANEAIDLYSYGLEAGLQYLLNTPPPNELIILLRSLCKALLKHKLSTDYAVSFLFFRVLAPSLMASLDLEKRFQDLRLQDELFDADPAVVASNPSSPEVKARSKALSVKKNKRASVPMKERPEPRLSRGSAELRIDLDLLKSLEAERELDLTQNPNRGRHSGTTIPIRSPTSPSEKYPGTLSSKPAGWVRGILNPEKTTSPRKTPSPRETPSPKDASPKGSSDGELKPARFSLLRKPSSPSPRLESKKSSGDLPTLADRTSLRASSWRKASPKTRMALEDPVFQRYLSNIARIYTRLANGSLPESDSSLNVLVSKVSYLKPLMETIVGHIAGCQLKPKTLDRTKPFEFEMGEIHSDLFLQLAKSPSLISEEEMTELLRLAGGPYNSVLVREVARYLQSHAL